MITRWAAAALVLLVAACGGTPPITLSPEWPERPPELDEATRAWTRHDELVTDFSEGRTLVADLSATFKSPQWRAAKVRREVERGDLGEAEARARLEAEKQDASQHHEFFLLLTTRDPRVNDLTKGERSIWSVRLRDGRGNEVEPISIKKDRRPRNEIETELPHLGDFDQVYVARFPATHPILGPEARKFGLRMWSGHGVLELEWRAP